LNLDDQELELGSKGVGNVFLPLLQKCSNSTSNKRKIGDDSVDVDDDVIDLGISRGVKSSYKKAVGLGDLGVSRGFKSSNKKVADVVTVDDDDAFDVGGSRDIKSAGKALIGSDETRAKEDSRTLKILSYNVWFADIEPRIRMRAIGDIIQLHSPDVICLQEVTPDIYAIFQRTNWWKSYKCSLSSDKAMTRGYFCMQLSKLPVKSFGCKQFSYSAMARELCIAEVSTHGDTPLVVATSHLESPCPGPPKWDQMYSKERVKQANEAVDFLKKNPNAIFCGDMNWDDKLDGEFPLPDGWIDAWTELKPKEIGWTYDTKANPMLSANRKLQKRLDRFLISLRDFKAESIKMVGTERIPEVTYMKAKKGKPDLELPVLPKEMNRTSGFAFVILGCVFGKPFTAADNPADLVAVDVDDRGSHDKKSADKALVTCEDVEIHIRMRAIGDIIQLHSPDIICLQEVTPNIYAIFQRSDWWKSYKCSLSFDKASTRRYFCMQLSKLPVKSFGCKQFSYSVMERELCIAEVSTHENIPLVVATSHLESPCPGPPTWDQMYSKERVKQANEAVDFLNKNPNAIFCGDMNWEDELDGEFPLPDGWIDAWTELNPTDVGWTFDTKANQMISANQILQKRIDRFLISSRDFKVESVNMIGTERIPEVTYKKQKEDRTELELPVFPSDHFGLLLTISAR
ncbi:endonuclease/exonuclease/phosphatase family protein, partial [Tanacetum coccineum]